MIPTPAEFMLLDNPDEDHEQEDVFTAPAPVEADPLSAIAYSLQRLVAVAEREGGTASDEGASDTPFRELEERYLELDTAYNGLEQNRLELRRLVDEISDIVKPSTSKLANAVRAAIARHDDPEPTEQVETSEEPIAEAKPVELQQPANDADVEAWALYAESLGFEVLDTMNRSQIRTMLGIEHPEVATAEPAAQ